MEEQVCGRIEWFNGDKDALDLYQRLVFVAHTWDDLIDKDRPVEGRSIDSLVENLLLHLPGNAFYRRFEDGMRAHMFSSIAGYKAANLMEKTGDPHKVEIAHYLRYAVVNVVSFMLVAIHGTEGAAVVLAEIMPTMMPERVADYVLEILKNEG